MRKPSDLALHGAVWDFVLFCVSQSFCARDLYSRANKKVFHLFVDFEESGPTLKKRVKPQLNSPLLQPSDFANVRTYFSLVIDSPGFVTIKTVNRKMKLIPLPTVWSNPTQRCCYRNWLVIVASLLAALIAFDSQAYGLQIYRQSAISHPVIGHQGMVSCLLYTSPSPRDGLLSRMPSSA